MSEFPQIIRQPLAWMIHRGGAGVLYLETSFLHLSVYVPSSPPALKGPWQRLTPHGSVPSRNSLCVHVGADVQAFLRFLSC